MCEPCDLSAFDVRAAIGSRQLSRVELPESCVARIEKLEPALDAIVIRWFERARVGRSTRSMARNR